jgi:hypothetical protein
MVLPSPASTNWTAIVAAAARTQMNAVITIYNPSAPAAPYLPTADTGGYTGPTVIQADVPARIVFIRRPQEVSSADEWTTKRLARIQVPLDAVPAHIPKGSMIRVTAGGDDPNLLQLAFQVTAAANGSLAAVRTIECISSLVSTPVVA